MGYRPGLWACPCKGVDRHVTAKVPVGWKTPAEVLDEHPPSRQQERVARSVALDVKIDRSGSALSCDQAGQTMQSAVSAKGTEECPSLGVRRADTR